jgi:hypothetical protein
MYSHGYSFAGSLVELSLHVQKDYYFLFAIPFSQSLLDSLCREKIFSKFININCTQSLFIIEISNIYIYIFFADNCESKSVSEVEF